MSEAAGPSPAPPGPVLFARYAYPPHELGYCGPPEAAGLLESVSKGTDMEWLSRTASQFTGAWPSLTLIARCNGMDDPLDPRVVEAYWVGNELLNRVGPSETVQPCAGEAPSTATTQLPPRGAAIGHHSYQVFAVYPWLGMLRSGGDAVALTVLDRCRIRWGVVESVSGETARVRSPVLRWEDSGLTLGPEEVEVARTSREGIGLAATIAVGDMVTLHWDWVCDRLSPAGLASLRRYTEANLAAVNAVGMGT